MSKRLPATAFPTGPRPRARLSQAQPFRKERICAGLATWLSSIGRSTTPAFWTNPDFDHVEPSVSVVPIPGIWQELESLGTPTPALWSSGCAVGTPTPAHWSSGCAFLPCPTDKLHVANIITGGKPLAPGLPEKVYDPELQYVDQAQLARLAGCIHIGVPLISDPRSILKVIENIKPMPALRAVSPMEKHMLRYAAAPPCQANGTQCWAACKPLIWPTGRRPRGHQPRANEGIRIRVEH